MRQQKYNLIAYNCLIRNCFHFEYSIHSSRVSNHVTDKNAQTLLKSTKTFGGLIRTHSLSMGKGLCSKSELNKGKTICCHLKNMSKVSIQFSPLVIAMPTSTQKSTK